MTGAGPSGAEHQLTRITTDAEYAAALGRIRRLQQALLHAVMEHEGSSAQALALSEEIDSYVVMVQRYWDAVALVPPQRPPGSAVALGRGCD